MDSKTYVSVIKKGDTFISEIPFEDIDIGDVFFADGCCHECYVEAHYSGDASYDGYLLYDEIEESWFPDELDSNVKLSDEELKKLVEELQENGWYDEHDDWFEDECEDDDEDEDESEDEW